MTVLALHPGLAHDLIDAALFTWVAWGVLLTLAIVVPLIWRRRWPGLVLVASGTALLAADAACYHVELAWLAPILAVYSLACYRQRPGQLWPLVIWAAEVLAHYPLARPGTTALGLAGALAAPAATR